MKVLALTVLAFAGISGCGQAANSLDRQPAGETTATGAPEARLAPEAAPQRAAHAAGAHHVDLTAYVGKYPFDVVNGHRFLDNPEVKAAILAAVPDAEKRAAVVFEKGGLGLPIKQVQGGRILAWGGANHAEDRYNWSVVLAPDGSAPQVCIYDGLGYEDDSAASQWFEPGQPSVMKQGKCPSDAEDYPAAQIVAG
ncbi:hypothetical protein HT136_13165 [Novosphingobium profundi]|uniref:hypothetical protein n=1 Tax=Novosphingobium profundi TaxID=1774954 RepID=UPI001BD92595|nr:hypothetical protein [Novosphingobium profundi]MBT0669315.1 hypothetical protein [Novosphingobium profundi]